METTTNSVDTCDFLANAGAASLTRVPHVAIVILNWNALEVTRDCLLSLRNIDYTNYETILVDNGSTDGSADRLAADFPEVSVIRNNSNLGFAAGNNVGIRYALQNGVDYVLLLNNDTIVSGPFLSLMIDAMEHNPGVGISNPTIYYTDPPNKAWYAGGSFSPWVGFAQHHGPHKHDPSLRNPTRPVTFITGCAFLIKAEVIRGIGLLDETFFMVYEDADWSVRALRAGFKAICVVQAEIAHRESYTIRSKKGKAFRDYYNARNVVLLARKHARFYHWPSFAVCLFIYLMYRTTGYAILRQTERISALLRGLRDGLTQPLTRQIETYEVVGE